jgi:uncharacterized protein YjaG (DUF416 family)
VTDGVTTETLCERLAPLLRVFLKAVDYDNIEESKFIKYGECLKAVNSYVVKNDIIKSEIDLESLDKIIQATKPKRQSKASIYIRVLVGVNAKAGVCINAEKCIFKNTLYVKRVFGGGPHFFKFLM